jgi:hypothetical protein
VKIRPEAEQRLRAGFQRHVDEQRHRYAAQLAYAGQLAARYECGQVVGVFNREAGIGWKTLVTGLLPLAAVPFLINRSFKNVEDPYHEMGQLFRSLAPATIGATMPTFPTIDQVIAAYAS